MSTDSCAPARCDDGQAVARLHVDELTRLTLQEQWRRQLEEIVSLSQDALTEHERNETGAQTTERLLSSQLLTAARRQLTDTEEALARLKDGSYGTCTSCGEAIRPERLEVLPAARYCVGCQARTVS